MVVNAAAGPDRGSWSDDFGSELDRKIWLTKGARFNAYRRLRKQHELSLRAISFLSAYLIVLSIFLLLPDIGLDESGRRVAGVGTIAMSLFILVLSLLESTKNAQLRAEVHHNCGLDLSRLYDRLRIALTSAAADRVTLQTIADEYGNILQRFNENHEPEDDLLFRAQHKVGFGRIATWRVHWVERIRIAGFYWALILVPPVVAAALLTRS
jgi:hypothetical protein